MMIYKSVIPPVVALGTLAIASLFGTVLFKRLRIRQKRRLAAAITDWEDEGGRGPRRDGGSP